MTIFIWPPAGTGSGSSNVNIFDSNGLPIAEGQKTMAASLPVVIASDQSALPITFGGPTNYGTPDATTPRQASMTGVGATAVSVSNPMPCELTDGTNFYNAPLRAQLPAALGQATEAASLAVVIASNQSAVPTTLPYDENFGAVGATTLRTASLIGVGATAVSATNPVPVELSNGGAFYNTVIATQLPTVLGQQVMANSLTVAIASNQSPIPVTSTPATLDFGASAAAERVAALVGNTTGIADFNYGAVGAQTLRTAAELAVANAAVTTTNPVPTQLSNGATSYNTNTAAQLPTTLGQQLSAASLGVVIASDQSALPVTISGGALNFGAAAAAQRVAALLGNVTGIADFGAGVETAQTLRTAAQLDVAGAAVSVTNPVPVELSNGTTFYNAPIATQLPAALGQTTSANSLAVVVSSNQSAIPVTVSSLPATSDTNYGTPTVSTLRTASMLGMGSTAVAVTNPVNVSPGDGTNTYTSTAIAAAQKTVATATSVPENVCLSLGWDGTTHREHTVDTSGNTIISTSSTTATTPFFVELSTGAAGYNTNTAAQLPTTLGQTVMASSLAVTIASNQSALSVTDTNFPTTVDTNFGNPSVSTIRVAAQVGIAGAAVTAANPINVVPGNATANYSSGAIAAAQFTVSTAAAVPETVGLALGWDGTTHREIAVSTTGLLQTSLGGLVLQGSAALDTSSTNISTTYVQLVASTTAAVSWLSCFNGSGSVLQIGVGAIGSEVLTLIVPPGGVEARVAIASGQRVAIKQTAIGVAMTSGFLTLNLLG